MESKPVDWSSPEHYRVLLCAVRYACGRRTYMPGLVTDYIMENEPDIPKAWAQRMIDDIEFQRKHGGLGDDCDIKIWEGFILWLEEAVKRNA